LKKFLATLLVLILLAGSCTAEELNEVWNSAVHDSPPPETVYYPEFQLSIPDEWQVQYLRPNGRVDIYIPDASGRVDYIGVPMSMAGYVPYEELGYRADAFDETALVPGSYEFRQQFVNTYFFGGNQIDCLFRIRAGDNYGMAVCLSQDGDGINHHNLRICTIIVPGDKGVFGLMAFIGGKEDEVEAYCESVCLAVAENLNFNGVGVEIMECDLPPYMIRSHEDYRSNAPLEWRLVSSSGLEATSVYNIPVEEVCWKFEVGGCTVEKKLLLADGLDNENLEFIADAETGISVRINGREQASRGLKGLENGSAEYIVLDDGSEALVYEAVYETSARTWYFSGAVFKCEEGVAMPFISSQEPIPEGLLYDAISLYFN